VLDFNIVSISYKAKDFNYHFSEAEIL